MQISNVFAQSNGICKFSPNGQFLASSNSNKLHVRNVLTLKTVEIFNCADVIQTIKWSSDSAYILCGMFKRRLVEVWSLENPSWTCKIDEGSLGLIKVGWSPDGRHILTTARFHLRITIWSLLNKSIAYMKFAKQVKHGMSFSPCGTYLALAERRNCHDYVSVFTCQVWHLLQNFRTDTTDLGGILWSPSSNVLCFWDAVPANYNVLLYSLDGHCIATYSAYQYALGVKSLVWSPTSQFLAVGSYDQKVRLLNHLTWKPISSYDHPNVLNDTSINVFQETTLSLDHLPLSLATSTISATKCQYKHQDSRLVHIPCTPIDYSKNNPKYGIGSLAFSSSGRFLLSINDNMPSVFWIWDLDTLSIRDVVIQEQPVKATSWHPSESKLAVCTGNKNVYYWSPEACTLVEIPCAENFEVLKLEWHSSGQYLLVIGKDNMCLIVHS